MHAKPPTTRVLTFGVAVNALMFGPFGSKKPYSNGTEYRTVVMVEHHNWMHRIQLVSFSKLVFFSYKRIFSLLLRIAPSG